MSFKGYIEAGNHFPVKGLKIDNPYGQKRLQEAVDHIGSFAYGHQIQSSSPSADTTINSDSYISVIGIAQSNVISPVFAKLKVEAILSFEITLGATVGLPHPGTMTVQIMEGSNVKATIPYNPGGLFMFENSDSINLVQPFYALFSINPKTAYTIDVKAKSFVGSSSPDYKILKDSSLMICTIYPRIPKND